MSSPAPDSSTPRGYVIPIGGAEERIESPQILTKFSELCGGENARIAIIPTASNRSDTGKKYVEIFHNIGVETAVALPVNDRKDAEQEKFLNELDRADGIFLTGGNQLRLSTILGGTEMAQRLRRLNAAGVHIAGTSAGAAIMPEHMIAGGASGIIPSRKGVNLAPGLGLINSVLIDQHFSQRDRFGRLLTAISYNPFLIGVGIDENTSVFIDPDRCFEVVGSGAVTVVDPSEMTYSSMSEAVQNEPLSLLDLRLHMLSSGCRYDISERTAYPPEQAG